MRDTKDTENRRPLPDAEADGIIEGRNAVIEALRVGTPMDKIYIAKGETDKTLGHIASKARSAGIVVVEADRRKLDNMSRTHAHQGVIALAAVREYATVESILQAAADRGEPQLLVVCDELYAGGAGAQYPGAAEGSEKAGRVGVRHGSRRQYRPVSGGSEGACGHRYRLRGHGHDAPCRGKLRFSGEHSHERKDILPERQRRGSDPAVRGRAPAGMRAYRQNEKTAGRTTV